MHFGGRGRGRKVERNNFAQKKDPGFKIQILSQQYIQQQTLITKGNKLKQVIIFLRHLKLAICNMFTL